MMYIGISFFFLVMVISYLTLPE